ncbi:MAG: hypothetical protein K2V38_02835 [Gemmataceae bacterium]|nr:hypothetical protein [Gemmataceae bacterium]
MPIPVVCPGCAAKLNAPDAAAGKKVKCPKCQSPITIPAAVAAPQFEVVEDEAEPTSPVKKAPVKAVSADAGDEDEKPRGKKIKADEDREDDEPPRKKKKKVAAVADDEDEDEKPRKKKKKKAAAGGGSSLARNVIGGVVLVVLVGVAGVIFYNKLGKKEETASNTPPGGDPPTKPEGPGPRPEPKLPDKKGPEPKNTPDTTKPKLQNANVNRPHRTADGKFVLAQYITTDRFSAFGVWDRQTGDPLLLLRDDKTNFLFSSVSGISPDRKQVAIVSAHTSSLTLWKVADGSLEKTIKLPPAAKSGGVSPAFALYSTDGKAVVTAYEKALLRVDLETEAQQVLLELTNFELHALSYSTEKNMAVYKVGSFLEDGELRVADLNRPGNSFALPLKQDDRLLGRPDISADGKTVVAYVEDRTTRVNIKRFVNIYDTASRQLKGQILLPTEGEDPSFEPLSVSADGNRVVCGNLVRISGGGRVGKYWSYDVPTRTLCQVGPDFKESFYPMRVTGDGKTVGIWHGVGLQLYDAETGKRSAP